MSEEMIEEIVVEDTKEQKKVAKVKKERNFVWFFILGFIVVLGASIPTELIGYGLAGAGLELSTFSSMLWMDLFVGFAMISLFVWLIVRFREKGTLASLGLKSEGALKKYGTGFAIGLGMMGLSALLIYILGGMQISFSGEGIGFSYLPTILLILIGWTVQGSTEEILTRGWMLPRLIKRYNPIVGIAVSSVFFMTLHLGNDGIQLMPVLNLTLFAVFAALYTIYHGNIWGICGFHVAWNWMQGNLLGVEVSGSIVPGGSLIKMSATGNELISGGSFGIEGSVIASMIFLIAVIYYIVKIKKNGIKKEIFEV